MLVTIQDSRVICGKFMSFDKHMNLILGDAEEFRKVAGKGKLKEEKEEKRTLGLVLIRGECVVSLSVEGPPIEENKARIPPTAPGGPGVGRAAARGVVLPIPGVRAAGLGGPVRGVGGPAPAAMMPQPPMRPPTTTQVTAPPNLYPAPPRPPMPMTIRPPGAPPGFPMPGGMPPPFAIRPGMPPGGMPPMPPGSRPPGMPGMPLGVVPRPGIPPGVPGRPPGIPPQMGVPRPMPPGMPPQMGQPMPRPPY